MRAIPVDAIELGGAPGQMPDWAYRHGRIGGVFDGRIEALALRKGGGEDYQALFHYSGAWASPRSDERLDFEFAEAVGATDYDVEFYR